MTGTPPRRRSTRRSSSGRHSSRSRPTSQDVITIVNFARDNGMQVAPQRTGHNAEPLGDLSELILVKTDALQGVEIDVERRIARVASGAKWAEVVPLASELGPRSPARLDTGRECHRLLAGRRRRLVRTQAGPLRQQRRRDRARHARRTVPPRRPRERSGALLGAPRRRRQLRHRHGDRGAALPDHRHLRRRALLPVGAVGGGAAHLERVDEDGSG